MSFWQTSRRAIDVTRPLVMGILNVTPDSFSDGGQFVSLTDALVRAEQMVAEGVDIIDVGGESTRPGSVQVAADVEIDRTTPVITEITRRFDVAVSIDTTKPLVASAALQAGAEIVNDISGLRWQPEIAGIAAESGAGLILMHSRGEFGTMHSPPPAGDIISVVREGLTAAVACAKERGVSDRQIALDPGIGFGKSMEQTLDLIAKLDKIVSEFENYPMLVGTSRKSFIGKLLGDIPTPERLPGSIATAVIALERGAKILRVHDVKETVAAVRVFSAIAENTK